MPDRYQNQLLLSEFSVNYNSEILPVVFRDRHNH